MRVLRDLTRRDRERLGISQIHVSLGFRRKKRRSATCGNACAANTPTMRLRLRAQRASLIIKKQGASRIPHGLGHRRRRRILAFRRRTGHPGWLNVAGGLVCV